MQFGTLFQSIYHFSTHALSGAYPPLPGPPARRRKKRGNGWSRKPKKTSRQCHPLPQPPPLHQVSCSKCTPPPTPNSFSFRIVIFCSLISLFSLRKPFFLSTTSAPILFLKKMNYFHISLSFPLNSVV